MQSEVANKTECGLLGDLRWHRRPTGQLPRKRRAPCAEAIGIRTCGNCSDTMIAPHLRGRTDRHHSSGLPRSRRTAAHPARNPIHRPRVRRQSSTASG